MESLNKKLEKWKNSDEFILILAAFRWKAAIREIERQKKTLKNNEYLEMHYENLITNPNNELLRILRFIGHEPTFLDEKRLTQKLYSSKPLKELYNSKQLKILNEILHDELSEFGYL